MIIKIVVDKILSLTNVNLQILRQKYENVSLKALIKYLQTKFYQKMKVNNEYFQSF